MTTVLGRNGRYGLTLLLPYTFLKCLRCDVIPYALPFKQEASPSRHCADLLPTKVKCSPPPPPSPIYPCPTLHPPLAGTDATHQFSI